jgi:hypothetical protein
MNKKRLLFLGLTVYECFRLLFLAGALAALNSAEGLAVFPLFSLAAANALFLLAALFLFLDFPRYRRYLPLYTAGKLIVFFVTAGWVFFFRQSGFAAPPPGSRVFTQDFLIYGDLLSAAAGLFVIFRMRAAGAGKPCSEDGGEQCE